MTTITLESIKTEQSRIAEMIAAFEAQPAVRFPLSIAMPDINEGERYVGVIISAEGTKRHHVILLPGEIDNANWEKSTKWAESLGGALPDRVESALLFATMKDEFKPEWYWTRELYAPESGYAWCQKFSHGSQGSTTLSASLLHARDVRRLPV